MSFARISPIEQEEIDKSPKHTLIGLGKYQQKGLIIRKLTSVSPLALINEDPLDVFKQLVGNFHVTRFKGQELYGNLYFQGDEPMLGLDIQPIEPEVRIYTSIRELKKLENVTNLKRELTQREVERINRTFELKEREVYMGWLDSRKEIKDYEIKQSHEFLAFTMD